MRKTVELVVVHSFLLKFDFAQIELSFLSGPIIKRPDLRAFFDAGERRRRRLFSSSFLLCSDDVLSTAFSVLPSVFVFFSSFSSMATTDLFTDVELITTGTGGFSRDSWKALLPGPLSLCSIQSSLTIFMTHIHLRFEDLLRPFPSVNSQHHLTASASIEKALFVHGEPLTRRPDPEARGLDICRTIFPDKIYYAINVHAWPPSNLTGRCAYSGEDNSSTTFVFYSSSGSISSIFDNHLPLSTACFAWSGVDEQASEGWARPIKRLVIANPFSSSSKPITVKKKSNHAFVILLGFASIIKISGGFTEIYVSNVMYLSCLKNLPVNLPRLFLSPSPFSSEEKTLPPFPLPLERDDSSASLPSVCFSFFIGLLSCGAVSTGPEDATEITLVILVDEVWTSTSHYVTIPQLSDIVVKASTTHSSIVSNSLSSSIEDLSCLVYLSVAFSVYGQKRMDNSLFLLYGRILN